MTPKFALVWERKKYKVYKDVVYIYLSRENHCKKVPDSTAIVESVNNLAVFAGSRVFLGLTMSSLNPQTPAHGSQSVEHTATFDFKIPVDRHIVVKIYGEDEYWGFHKDYHIYANDYRPHKCYFRYMHVDLCNHDPIRNAGEFLTHDFIKEII